MRANKILMIPLVLVAAACSSTYSDGTTSSGAAAATLSAAPPPSCQVHAETAFIANGQLYGRATVSCATAPSAYALTVKLQVQTGDAWKDIGQPTTSTNVPTATAHGFMADGPCSVGKSTAAQTVRVDVAATETRGGTTDHYSADSDTPLPVNSGDC